MIGLGAGCAVSDAGITADLYEQLHSMMVSACASCTHTISSYELWAAPLIWWDGLSLYQLYTHHLMPGAAALPSIDMKTWGRIENHNGY